ncbi:MAG: hypothetical protein ABEJ24_03065 [Candidatus Magasanikbacteria bacterium]
MKERAKSLPEEYKEDGFENTNFKKDLFNTWKEKFPEQITDFDTEDLKGDKKDLEEREEVVRAKNLLEELEIYGYDTSKVEVLEDGKVRIEISNHFDEYNSISNFNDDIDDQYAYEGGAARSLLLRNLDIDPDSRPRDVDIIRLPDKEEPYEGADEDLAKEFMPDDFKHGYGVEQVENLQDYFQTRDLTVNELYATDEEIIATKECVRDAARHIVRLTDFERENILKNNSKKQTNKMLSKMIRFYAKFLRKYGENSDISLYKEGQQENKKPENYSIRYFWIALQLDRAFEEGATQAKEFVRQLKKRDQLPDSISDDPYEVAEFLTERLGEENFHFRNAPSEQFELEEEWKEYEKIPKQAGMGRGV